MDQSQKSERLADDLLFGADAIALFLSELTGQPVTADQIYYGASNRSKVRLPVGRYGKLLAGSKKRLTRHVREAVSV
jgi:hypothetical protein